MNFNEASDGTCSGCENSSMKSNHYSKKYYVISSARSRKKLNGNNVVSVCNDCDFFQEREGLFDVLLNMIIAWTPVDLRLQGMCMKCRRPLLDKSKFKIVFEAGGDWIRYRYRIPVWCPLEDQDPEPRPTGMPDDWPKNLEWHNDWSVRKNIDWRKGWGK